MEASNKSSQIPQIMADFQHCLGGSISNTPGICKLHLDNTKINGYISHSKLQKGISALDIVVHPIAKQSLPFNAISSDLMLFISSVSGNCYHQFDSLDDVFPIVPQTPILVPYPSDSSGAIELREEEAVAMNIILVEKKTFFPEKTAVANYFNNELYYSINQISTTLEDVYEGNFNPKLGEQVNLLLTAESNNSVSDSLLHLGRYYVILAKHIEQFFLDTTNKGTTSKLLKKELKCIVDVSDVIINAPEHPHTIKSLCLESGLSPSKLQEGFKFLFERTVTDYVRHTRLEKAEQLLCTTDLTISEIVYSVGLTSRSYFCKIFRNRYHCSPTEYKNALGLRKHQNHMNTNVLQDL